MSQTTGHYHHANSLSSRAMEWLHHFFEPPRRSHQFKEERRHLPRTPLEVEIRVSDQTLRSFQGKTKDISHNGLFIELHAPPPPPGSILRLHLGAGPLNGPFDELVAVVTRISNHSTPGIGVEILESISPPKALRRFSGLLANHQRAA